LKPVLIAGFALMPALWKQSLWNKPWLAPSSRQV
jgi:hypothetical protein